MAWEGFPTEQIHPGDTLVHFSSVALDGEYDRIRGTLASTSISREVQIARGGVSSHPPTLSYNLGPAIIADGTLYYPGGYEVMKAGMAKPIAYGRPRHFAVAQLCNSSLTEGFFGHWLLDTPALMILAEQRGMPAVAVQTTAGSDHRTDYTRATGSPLEQVRLARIEQLWIVDDRPTNLGRASRLRELRRRIREGVTGSSKRLILDRGLGGARRNLTNSQELWAMLESEHGFEIIDPLAMSFADLAVALNAAEIVVGVEGSALCHAVLASPENVLIFAIMPPTRFCTAVKWYTDMLGMKFGFCVAEGSETDFAVDVGRMRRAMAQVEQAVHD